MPEHKNNECSLWWVPHLPAVHPYEPYESITWAIVVRSDCFNFQSCPPTEWLEMPLWQFFSNCLSKKILRWANLQLLVLADRDKEPRGNTSCQKYCPVFRQLPIFSSTCHSFKSQYEILQLQWNVSFLIKCAHWLNDQGSKKSPFVCNQCWNEQYSLDQIPRTYIFYDISPMHKLNLHVCVLRCDRKKSTLCGILFQHEDEMAVRRTPN